MKNKKVHKKFWIILIVITILIIGGIIDWWFFRDSETIILNEEINTIWLSINGEAFAYVYVVDGKLDADIMDKGADEEIQILRTSFEEISKKDTLPIIGEPELGRIVEYQIPKNSSDYIYAVERYLEKKGFETKSIHTEYIKQSGKLSWVECSELYAEIDGDLKNANYCEEDSDCKTLPLGSSYIEFGCYHYINLEENSTDFYDRMNYYSVSCSDIIDFCSSIPESKCASGKCVEYSLPIVD